MLEQSNLVQGLGSRDAAPAVRISYSELESWATDILTSAGMAGEEARLAAQALVRTDARGFPTHGVARLKSYLSKARDGELNLRARPITTVADGVVRIKADRQFGQVAGARAIDRMCDLARDRPVVVGILEDSGHLGALGVLALRAAEDGLVAVILQSTRAIMGVLGAQGPLIGNNPLALAAPRSDGPPLVLDMACSVAARGNILLAARSQTAIPNGWAIDAHGHETTDPDEALMGALLPFGGHKGLLVAMLVEVLAGSLTGATFLGPLNAGGVPRSAVACNALLMVFNPTRLSSAAAFESHMHQWIANFKSFGSPPARIPGERAHAAELEARQSGISLVREIGDELRAVGQEHGIPFPGGRESNAPQGIRS
ncbi:MAG: Ldh family oxidoreductase [Dongiaceae bacterium]